MQFCFKNGSYIESIDASENRRNNPKELDMSDIDWFCDFMGFQLFPYQKVYMWLMCHRDIHHMRNTITRLAKISTERAVERRDHIKKTDIDQARESIKVLRSMLSTNQWEPVRKELEFAIQEVSKCIPSKPRRERWQPNLCPCCGADLGGKCDDGYYENPYYEICPVCRQSLDYE